MNNYNVTITVNGHSENVIKVFNNLTEKYQKVKPSQMAKINDDLFCQTFEVDIPSDKDKLSDDVDFINTFYGTLCNCEIFSTCYENLSKGWLKLLADYNSIYYIYDESVSLINAVHFYAADDKVGFINTIKSAVEATDNGKDYTNEILNIYNNSDNDMGYLKDRLFIFLFDNILIN